jgi:hypothetical protein
MYHTRTLIDSGSSLASLDLLPPYFKLLNHSSHLSLAVGPVVDDFDKLLCSRRVDNLENTDGACPIILDRRQREVPQIFRNRSYVLCLHTNVRAQPRPADIRSYSELNTLERVLAASINLLKELSGFTPFGLCQPVLLDPGARWYLQDPLIIIPLATHTFGARWMLQHGTDHLACWDALGTTAQIASTCTGRTGLSIKGQPPRNDAQKNARAKPRQTHSSKSFGCGFEI